MGSRLIRPGRTTTAVLLLLLLAACAGRSGDEPDPSATEAVYVGEAECTRCHLGIAGTYAQTGMGRAWYRMTPAVAVEDFSERNEIEIPSTGLRYRMIARDGRYFMRQFRLDPDGAEFAADERELVWVIGSNHHSRAYVTMLGDKMFQAPICWYPDATLWDACPGFEYENSHFSREITESCVFCHNGRMVLTADDVSTYREPIPHGIGCERCHGPGSRHVTKWRESGATQGDEPDDTIVNPRRLSSPMRNEICFQCHLGDSKATIRVTRYDRSLLDFRPGRSLGEVTVPFRYEQAIERDFGISAQADRMILSRCYAESGGRLECITCHNPHVTVYHPERPAELFRRACLRCHASEDCGEAHGARRQTERLADDCVRCHMRVAEPDDQLHTTITDHWIRRSIEVDEREPRRSTEIVPVLSRSFERLPDADREFYEGRANLLLSTRTPDRARRRMWESAERAFERAIGLGLDNEQSWFFLGKSLTYQGRTADAARAYRRSLERDPEHYDAAFALGQTLGAGGDSAGAVAVFESLVDGHSANAGALAELGRFRILAGRIEEGVALYDRAIAAEPWQASLRLNRGMGLAALGRFDEAARAAEDATRLDPDDVEGWRFYVRVMEAAGRSADASRGLRVLDRLSRRPD